MKLRNALLALLLVALTFGSADARRNRKIGGKRYVANGTFGAGLELGDAPDAHAESSARFSYRGMRERYGVVRARESILPFDLVLQGSLWDFSLGAFPRWRAPRETPDAYLYR